MPKIYPTAPNNANTYLPVSPVVAQSLEITAISQSYPCQVTISLGPDQVNEYQKGQLLYFSIPKYYGMQQLAGKTGMITEVSGNNIYVNVNSSNFDPFIVPIGKKAMKASICSAGSRNLYNYTQVPFHALNGLRGN